MMKKNKKTENTEEKTTQQQFENTAENEQSKAKEKPDKKDEKKAVKELEQLREEYRELDAKFRRLSADYANYQKRVPKQIEESISYKVEAFIKSLLSGIDNFDHALAHAEGADAKSLKDGINMVYENLLSILKGNGLEQIDAVGQKFDHNYHQAVMQKCCEDKEDGIVLEQYQKGYKFKGRVIRPAMVVVNKLPSQDLESKEDRTEESQNRPAASQDAGKPQEQKEDNSEKADSEQQEKPGQQEQPKKDETE